jgi:hypothetical protein
MLLILPGCQEPPPDPGRNTFDLDTDEMTITTRTTDTPPLAWILGPDDLTWDDAAAITWDDVDDWSDLDA